MTFPIRIAAIVLVTTAAAACGKKGPPLTPFVRVPAQVAPVTAVRIGGDIYVSFPVPKTNVDGEPVDIASLQVYAITASKPPDPTNELHHELATLVATVPVRPVLPDLSGVPELAAAAVPLVLPPGVDRDLPAVVRETLAPELLTPVVLPLGKAELERERLLAASMVAPEPGAGPLVAPAPAELPRRYYYVIGSSPRGRESVPSTPLAVALDTGSSAPGAPTIIYTETDLTVSWTPPADARTATLPPPMPVALPVAVPANASPAIVAPAEVPVGAVPAVAPLAPPPVPQMPLLPAKSLGFTTEATTYHLYEIPTATEAADPQALTVPVPLTPAPLATMEHVITGVTFGLERCFFARSVDVVNGAVLQGPASPTTCVTLADTFPPAAPQSLAAIAGAGVISLIWEPNTESDLAGYLVLRGDAPGATLQAITADPVVATTFRDTTVKPGARYVYVVVAVDRATPQNVSAQSSRVEETARQ